MESLREKLFGKPESLRNKLAGAAITAVGAVTRSKSTVSKGAEMMGADREEPKPTINWETDPNVDRDQFGNAIIPEQPPKNKVGAFARKLQNKVDTFFDKDDKELTQPQGEEVQIMTTSEKEKKDANRILDGVKDQDKEPIASAAEEIGVEPNVIAKILRGEGLNSTPEQLVEAEKREGAIGPGQHRDIFYKEWNPKFKERYGRNYDRKNLKDVGIVTSLAIKHYMDKYGALEPALIAYNKGESVVQDYINDPNTSFDMDPYVKGFKER